MIQQMALAAAESNSASLKDGNGDSTGDRKPESVAAMEAHAPLVAAAKLVIWPEFDAATVSAAVTHLRRALDRPIPVVTDVLSETFVKGDLAAFWSTMDMVGSAGFELCDLWYLVCRSQEAVGTPALALACVTAAFVRAGMPLRPPFRLRPIQQRTTPCQSPLWTAICISTGLAHALLDLPLQCGLDVDAVARIGEDTGPPLGFATLQITADNAMFERMLHRSEGSSVSQGVVSVHAGLGQALRLSTHVFIGLILRCAYSRTDPLSDRLWLFARAHMFVAAAHQDGSGTDLTGGASLLGQAASAAAAAANARRIWWPNRKFEGALPLLSSICNHHWSQGATSDSIVGQLETLLRGVTAAMQRVRVYRMWMPGDLSAGLDIAGIGIPALQTLIRGYVLWELHDPAQLDHPLLTESLPWG